MERSPSAYVDPTPGYHGNSTGIPVSKAFQMKKGVPWDGEMLRLYESRLARWGFTPEDLAAKGIDGDLTEQTAKLGVIVDLLWAAMLNAAALGQADRWEMLEHRYAKRVNQSIRTMHSLLERIGEANTKVIDYQDVLEMQERAADG